VTHSEAVAAVKAVLPDDHVAELSIRRLSPSPKVEGMRTGEVRRIDSDDLGRQPPRGDRPPDRRPR
jgi:hypothetical protein